MTKAGPCDYSELLECRDRSARWLAADLGVEPFRYPGRAATALLLEGGLTAMQAEVARQVVWLERALPADWVVEEYHRGDRVACYLRAGDDGSWYEVETDAPSEEELRLSVEVGARGKELNNALREFALQFNGVQKRFVRFADAGTNLSELVAERVRRGRIVRRVGAAAAEHGSADETRKAAEHALGNWKPERARWEGMMLKCATVGAEMDVFREMVQLGLPRDREAPQGFLNIMFPNSAGEWRTARRALEKRLHAVGFSDPAASELLPDRGGREGSGHRVASRRYRSRAGTAEE